MWQSAFLAAVSAFLILWFGRVIYYRRKLARAAELFALYRRYVDAKGESTPDHETLTRRTTEVHAFWREVGIQDSGIAYAEPIGWGRLATGHYSARDNWAVLQVEIVSWAWQAFNKMIGYFEDRAREARNPLYTLVAILKAPQAVIRWVGLGTGEESFPKVLSLVWSLFLAAAALVGFYGSLRDLRILP